MPKILVVRKVDEFSRILAASGYEILNLPLIETRILDDLSDFETKLAHLTDYNGIFLTSAKAAQIFAGKLSEKQIIFAGKVYVLGKSSFEILQNHNLNIVYDESANTAQEFLENIAPEYLEGKTFLFIRGEKSLGVVPKFLASKAKVEETIVYETTEIILEPDKIKLLGEAIENKEIRAVCFFSPSAVESFIKQFGVKILHQNIISTIGKTTAEFLSERGLAAGFVATKATAESFAIEFTNYLEKN